MNVDMDKKILQLKFAQHLTHIVYQVNCFRTTMNLPNKFCLSSPIQLFLSLNSLLFQVSVHFFGQLRLRSELLVPKFKTESWNTLVFMSIIFIADVCNSVNSRQQTARDSNFDKV